MGLIENKICYTYEDLTIKPCIVSEINHRIECNPFDKDGMLPLFTAPMDTVVNEENFNQFELNKITSILPRVEQYPLETRVTYATGGKWAAFSLDEFIHYFCTPVIPMFKGFPMKALIDVANGHMQRLFDAAKKAKSIWGRNLILMGGNIANEETYDLYADAGFDYVRIGIGGGKGCLSTSNTGVHKPMASLVNDTYFIKKKLEDEKKYEKLPYIIADGGIRNYCDVTKAIGVLGADYVMIGSLFNKAIESNGKTTYGSFYWNVRGKKILRPIKTLLYYGRQIPKNKYEKSYKLFKQGKLSIWKQFFGQSTKMAQTLINEANNLNSKLKTSEGLIKYQKVEYDIKGWAENETDYLKSAMSYTNSKTLNEYKDSQWIRISKIDYNK